MGDGGRFEVGAAVRCVRASGPRARVAGGITGHSSTRQEPLLVSLGDGYRQRQLRRKDG